MEVKQATMISSLVFLAFSLVTVLSQTTHLFKSLESLEWEGESLFWKNTPFTPTWWASVSWKIDGSIMSPGDIFTLEIPCVYKFDTGVGKLCLTSTNSDTGESIIYGTCDLLLESIYFGRSLVHCTLSDEIEQDTIVEDTLRVPIIFNAGFTEDPKDISCAGSIREGINDFTIYEDNELLVTKVEFRSTDDRGHNQQFRVSDSSDKVDIILSDNHCAHGYSMISLGMYVTADSGGLDCSTAREGITDLLNAWGYPVYYEGTSGERTCNGEQYIFEYNSLSYGKYPFILISANLPPSDSTEVRFVIDYICSGQVDPSHVEYSRAFPDDPEEEEEEEEETTSESFSKEEETASESVSKEEETTSESVSKEEETTSESVSKEEETTSESVSKEEETTSESVSKEEETTSESFSKEEETASESVSKEEETASESVSKEEETASESVSKEEETASESFSKEEETTSESFSKEEETASESVSKEEETASESVSEEEETASESFSKEESAINTKQEEEPVTDAVDETTIDEESTQSIVEQKTEDDRLSSNIPPQEEPTDLPGGGTTASREETESSTRTKPDDHQEEEPNTSTTRTDVPPDLAPTTVTETRTWTDSTTHVTTVSFDSDVDKTMTIIVEVPVPTMTITKTYDGYTVSYSTLTAEPGLTAIIIEYFPAKSGSPAEDDPDKITETRTRTWTGSTTRSSTLPYNPDVDVTITVILEVPSTTVIATDKGSGTTTSGIQHDPIGGGKTDDKTTGRGTVRESSTSSVKGGSVTVMEAGVGSLLTTSSLAILLSNVVNLVVLIF
nr:agglutinin-like protein [Spathaspora passalidarum]